MKFTKKITSILPQTMPMQKMDLFTNGNWLSKPKYNGYAIGYALESIIGPIEVKYTWSPELNKGYAYFHSVGFAF